MLGRVDPPYLTRQLVTYLGNKRALLKPIEQGVLQVQARLGGRPLHILDAFAGSGVVSRLLKGHARRLVSNDLEPYAGVLGRCFLADAGSAPESVAAEVARLNREVAESPLPRGLIAELYAPVRDDDIQPGERAFYTADNARRLDDYRRRLDDVDPELFDLLLGPLLVKASVHANTAGVFKGFYKDRHTGRGRFGGTGADALRRIRGRIELEVPVLGPHRAEVEVTTEDANQLVRRKGRFDLAYLDPPYNEHPYGSNYFMLNLLTDYARPAELSRVSGIPADWQRSDYNRRRHAAPAFEDLVAHLEASHVLVSFSDEGFFSPERMQELLSKFGRVEVLESRAHPAFRGSRSFEGRSVSVTEHLFLLEK